METQNQPLIKTTDINLAATLLCLGFDINGIDNADKNHIAFYFKKLPQLETAIDNYWRGKLLINPLEFSNTRRELITRIKHYESFEEHQQS